MGLHLKIVTPETLAVGIVLPILLAFFSAWTFKIFQDNKLLTIFQIILAILLFLTLSSKLSKKFILIICFALIINCLFFVITHFDPDLTQTSALEKSYITTRQNYYPHGLGKYIHNSYSLSFYRIERNFFTNLDFNQFFFGGAPRFRSYALDFDRFPLLFLPFFIFGVYKLMKKVKQEKIIAGTILIGLIICSLGNPDYIVGIYPLYPIILAITSFGIYKIYA